MLYEPYVTYKYYCDVYKDTVAPMSELGKALRQTSRRIDSLAYNRIVDRGLSDLTVFRQDVIQEVVCRQVDSEYENVDEINTILSNYSLNGTSVRFGSSWNVYTDKGAAVKCDVCTLLSQTGLYC